MQRAAREPGRRRRAGAAVLVSTLAWVPACAGPWGSGPLPPGFARVAAEAPEAMPARLWLDGDRIVGAAAGTGPGGLPAAVRSAVEAATPGGELLFEGREWGPAGTGFRIDKRYVEGPAEAFRSALIAEDGSVLERSHSVPIPEVPAAVLTAAMAVGREVRRCDIVSGPLQESGWRAVVVDGGGRTFVAEVDLAGRLRRKHRVVRADLRVAAD